MNLLRKNILLTLLTILFTAGQASATWEEVTHSGVKYVTARSLKTFYKFTVLEKKDKYIHMGHKKLAIKMRENSQECIMNKVKFILSYPVISRNGRILISQTDLTKLIDPVLRPTYINKGSAFKTVILDPGHGGKDPGAVNQYGNESDYNLKVALKTRDMLKKHGFTVIMTRTSNTTLSLEQRVSIANRYKNAVYVSIHFNAGGAGKARGIETFTLSPKGVAGYGRSKRSSDNRTRPGNAQDSANIALATSIHWNSLGRVKVPDRGIKRARYSVLTTINIPAVLIEGGFMSHAYEARQIHNTNYQNNLAAGIAGGIIQYRIATAKK